MSFKIVLLLSVLFSFSSAKERFSKGHILLYLNEKNPFYYDAIGKEYIAQEEEVFHEGSLDTQFNMKYDNKSYPVSEGTYQYADIIKPMENGIEVSLAYRNAQGVQEYNNIKTGKDGEFLTGVKIPVLSVLNNISKNQVEIENARLNTKGVKQSSRLNLFRLYFTISRAYYQMLFQKEILKTETGLLEKARLKEEYISKQIKIGKLPEVAIFEIQGQVIDREQRLLSAENAFENAKNIFLQYLGLSSESFDHKYTLSSLPQKTIGIMSLRRAQNLAEKNRPELKEIEFEIKKTSLKQKYNDLEQYPKLNVGLYGAYDLEYQEGYKVSFDFNLPLERKRYKGRNESLRRQILLLRSGKLKMLREIKTSIQNILQKIKMNNKSILLARKELLFVEKLEKVENRKFKEGISDLVLVNQREIKTMQTKQKLFVYYYNLKLLSIELDYVLGIDHYKKPSKG